MTANVNRLTHANNILTGDSLDFSQAAKHMNKTSSASKLKLANSEMVQQDQRNSLKS